jgi:hypothetical protein
VQPIVLDATMSDTFYRRVGRIGRLHGVTFSDQQEDWVTAEYVS